MNPIKPEFREESKPKLSSPKPKPVDRIETLTLEALCHLYTLADGIDRTDIVGATRVNIEQQNVAAFLDQRLSNGQRYSSIKKETNFDDRENREILDRPSAQWSRLALSFRQL